MLYLFYSVNYLPKRIFIHMTKAQLKQLVREAIQEMSTDVSIDQLKDYFLKNPDKLELDLSGGEDVGVSEDSEYMGRNLTVDEAEELQHDRDFMKNIINAKGITKHDAVFGGRYESKGFTKAKLKKLIKEVLSEQTTLSKLPPQVKYLFIDDINDVSHVVKFINDNDVKSVYLILGSDAIEMGMMVDDPEAWYMSDMPNDHTHKALISVN